jgi:hypothetical protein
MQGQGTRSLPFRRKQKQPPGYPVRKQGHMTKKDYIQQNPVAFGLQLDTFKTNIGSYPTLGLSAGQITAQANDSDYFNYVVECQSIMQNDAKAATAWRDAVRGGNSAATPPAPTALPTPVAPVLPGVEPRFRALVGQTKAGVNYNVPIGTILGVEGIAVVAPDMTTLQPTITAAVTAGGVIISCNFGPNANFLDSLEIEVDRNDTKGYVNLTTDPSPNYTDTTPFPASATKWTYRAIYRVNDARVGQWSAPVSVMVG